MANSFFPSQIGFQPTGVNGVIGTSQLFFGRTISGQSPYDGPGFGAGGRPDYLQTMTINLVTPTEAGLVQRGTVTLNAQDLATIISGNSEAKNLAFSFRQLAVCEDGVEKGMVFLASQAFATGITP